MPISRRTISIIIPAWSRISSETPAPETTITAGGGASKETQAPEESEKPTDAPAADRDFAVTIDGSDKTKDYEGKPALVVNFTFTNNSDEAANFMFAAQTKAFQDGIELETAIVIDDKKYDADNSMKDIQPGKSLEVQQAFLLDGEDDVEITVTELISFDDTPLASATISVK